MLYCFPSFFFSFFPEVLLNALLIISLCIYALGNARTTPARQQTERSVHRYIEAFEFNFHFFGVEYYPHSIVSRVLFLCLLFSL